MEKHARPMPDLETVIADATADMGDIAPAGDTTPAADTTAATTTATTTAGSGDDDPFAKEYGLATRRADGKDNRIPYPRVKAIADNQVKKVVTQIAKELGISKAEAELKLEDIIGELGTRKTRSAETDTRLKNIDAIEQIMAGDPDRFMTMMAEANPAYKKFVEKQEAAAARTDTSTVRQADAVDANDPMPQPDLDLGEGRRTYSMDGLKKLREWDKRQTLREANDGFKKQLDERFKPIDEATKRDQERQRGEAINKQAREAVERRLARVAKWHGFKENEAEILKVIQSDPQIELEDAYNQVVMPKLQADRTKMREDILTELKAAPNATSTQAATPTVAAGGAPRSMEDIIREATKGLK